VKTIYEKFTQIKKQLRDKNFLKTKSQFDMAAAAGLGKIVCTFHLHCLRHTPFLVPQKEYVSAIGEVIGALIKAYEAQIPINLTKLKNDTTLTTFAFRLAYIPKLVDIIAAVPEEYKSKLLPYIKAKPVRTASGIG
jgi:hypothetical protein